MTLAILIASLREGAERKGEYPSYLIEQVEKYVGEVMEDCKTEEGTSLRKTVTELRDGVDRKDPSGITDSAWRLLYRVHDNLRDCISQQREDK